MATAILITTDPTTEGSLTAVLESHGFRVRSLASLESLNEWLTLQPCDLLVVDVRFQNINPIEVAAQAWQQNPIAAVVFVSPDGEMPELWDARLFGVQVLCGKNYLDDFTKLLNGIPTVLALAQNQPFMVLVVEDLDAPRSIIATYVESLGYKHVDTASDGPEALAILRKDPLRYFCVITDVNMPRMSGIEMTEIIRNDTDLDSIPVVALTAYASIDNLIACVRAGVTGFLVKPPQKKQLMAELQKCKRIVLLQQSARLCPSEDAETLAEALRQFELK